MLAYLIKVVLHFGSYWSSYAWKSSVGVRLNTLFKFTIHLLVSVHSDTYVGKYMLRKVMSYPSTKMPYEMFVNL